MVAGRPDGCLGAVVYAQFVENMNDMAFDSMGADVEDACDIVVAGAFRQNAENLQFPRRKGHGKDPFASSTFSGSTSGRSLEMV